MALTVTEKDHWRTRIARKISQAVEELLAKHNPAYLVEVAAAARNRATDSLGITQLLEEEKTVTRRQKELEADQRNVVRRLLAHIRGVDLSLVDVVYGWPDEVERAIRQRQKSAEQELLAADQLGQHILKLRREEDELLDTVWLATSPQQIRNLWQSMAELLSGELTPLQQQALTGPPSDDSDRGDQQ